MKCKTCSTRQKDYDHLMREPTKHLGGAFCQECGQPYEVIALQSDLEDDGPEYDDDAAEDDDE